MPEPIDLLIHPRWTITVEPDCQPHEDRVVAVHQGRIKDILSHEESRGRYTAQNEVRLSNHVLLPGLVNAHTHAAMSLFRGMADDLPLMEWLNDHIWPAERHWVNEEFVRIGTRLAGIEMLRSGTTCFNDMYFFPNVAADVAQSLNLRAVIGLIVLDFPTAWAADADEYLRKGTALYDELKDQDLVTAAFAPHAPYTVSDAPLKKLRVIADELDIPIHMHVHETAHEVEEAAKRGGIRPLERLSKLGLMNDRLIAVHMTQLLPSEIDAVAAEGVSIVHCPESNLKLASGMCPVNELVKSGANVALGTDGAASNNDLDMLGEMRTAALLAKGVSGDPTAVPAATAVRMATINGARALGLEQHIGSITPGKHADLIAVDLGAPETQPVHDPLAHIVYSAAHTQVSHVWVDGRCLMEERSLTLTDLSETVAAATRLGERILSYDHRHDPA